MKKFLSIALVLALAASTMAGCGGGGTASNGSTQEGGGSTGTSAPQKSGTTGTDLAGKYVIYRYGEGETSMDGELLATAGMDKSYLELNADHTGLFVLADAETTFDWNDAGEMSVSGAKLYTFEKNGDVVTIDMFGTPIALVKEGSDVPEWLSASGGRPAEEAGELITVQSARGFDLYYASKMSMNGTEYDCLEMGLSPADTNLQINRDGGAILTMRGTPTNMEFAGGKVSAWGSDLYTYEVVSADELTLDMQGTVYTFLREGSQLALAAGLTEDAAAGGGGFQMRHLIAGEEILELDGGTLYYDEDSEGVQVTYGYVNADDFYIPAEINGKTVYTVRRLHGRIKNLYVPSGVKAVYASFGDFDGLETLTFGYDGGKSQLKMYEQGGCGYGHFDHTNLKEISFPKEVASNQDFKVGGAAVSGAFDLTTVNNLPPIWKKGLDSFEKAEKMLGNPSSHIKPQSEKVTKLAEEITEGCTTDEEKVYQISKWVVENVSYDDKAFIQFKAYMNTLKYGGEYRGDEIILKYVEPEDVIDHKITVCAGYSELTKALCNAVGIPAVYMAGVITDMGEIDGAHAWNMVYLNGQWQYLDNTWNDSDYNSSAEAVDYEGDMFEDIDDSLFDGPAITYEKYLENEELREDYTWEEIQEMQAAQAEEWAFDAYHPYYLVSALVMSADRYATYVEDMEIPQ